MTPGPNPVAAQHLNGHHVRSGTSPLSTPSQLPSLAGGGAIRRPRVWLSRCPSTYRRSGTYRKLQPLPGAGSAPLLPTARLAAVLDPNQHLVFWVAVQPQESQAMPSSLIPFQNTLTGRYSQSHTLRL
jgi:hypothetical protein